QVDIAFFFDDKLTHESVTLFDAAFSELAGVAKILTSGLTGNAARDATRSSNRGHGEIAGFYARDSRSDLDNFTQRFVTDDQIQRPGRGCAVIERHNFLVGAADADIEHAQFDGSG